MSRTSTRTNPGERTFARLRRRSGGAGGDVRLLAWLNARSSEILAVISRVEVGGGGGALPTRTTTAPPSPPVRTKPRATPTVTTATTAPPAPTTTATTRGQSQRPAPSERVRVTTQRGVEFGYVNRVYDRPGDRWVALIELDPDATTGGVRHVQLESWAGVDWSVVSAATVKTTAATAAASCTKCGEPMDIVGGKPRCGWCALEGE